MNNIQTAIERALAEPALRNAICGIRICSPENGQTVYEKHADLSLVPASNLKLLTAIVLLTTRGTDFTYPTTLLHTGSVDAEGTLHGNLYLRGSGDPSLTSERLSGMATSLLDAGIKKIDGQIIGDGAVFDDKWLGACWQWDEEPYYYSAQIAGLNCDRNVMRVQVFPGAAVGDPVGIVLGGDSPAALAFTDTTYVIVRNTATTIAPDSNGQEQKSSLTFSRARARNEFQVGGTIPIGFAPVTVRLTIEDPTRFTATRFAEILQQCDMMVLPVAECVGVGATSDGAVVLAETHSGSLTELLKPFLKDSDNLFGEVFLKTMGDGTAVKGAQIIVDMLKSWGLDTSGLHQYDGSGLSRLNTLTPRVLTELLRYIDRNIDATIRDAFFDALPIAGVDGTLDDRMKGTAAEGRVWAKTGSLDNDSSISGYLETSAGERLVFAILMNHFAVKDMRIARQTQDAILLALIDLPLTSARTSV